MHFAVFAVISLGLSLHGPVDHPDRTAATTPSAVAPSERALHGQADPRHGDVQLASVVGDHAMHWTRELRSGSVTGDVVLASGTEAGPTIEVPATVPADTPILVKITDPEPGPKPWVTIVHEGAEPQSFGQYYYTSRRTSAEYEFRPVRPGTYEVRLHATERSQAPVAVATFSVGEAVARPGDAGETQATLEVPEQVLVGEKIPVKVLDPKPGLNPWVTIVREGAGPREYGAYYYTNGQTSAEFEFPKLEMGRYEVRLHAMDNSPGAIAVAPLAVVAQVQGTDDAVASAGADAAPSTDVVSDSGARLIVLKQVPMRKQIPVRVIDPEPGPSPWVTIVPQGAAGDAVGQVLYTHRQSSAKLGFKALRGGEYEVRFYASEGSSTPIAAAPLTVGPSGKWDIDPQDVQSRLVVPDEVPLGEKIRFEDVFPVPGDKPWITVVPKGSAEGAWIQLLGGTVNSPDVLEFDPLPPGEYEVRVHATTHPIQILAMAPFTIVAPPEGPPDPPGYGLWDPDVPAASAAMVRLEALPFNKAGRFIDIGFVYYFPRTDAWISIAEAGAPYDAGQRYLTRRTVSGTIRLFNPKPGDYEARYFSGGNSTVPLAVTPFSIEAK